MRHWLAFYDMHADKLWGYTRPRKRSREVLEDPQIRPEPASLAMGQPLLEVYPDDDLSVVIAVPWPLRSRSIALRL